MPAYGGIPQSRVSPYEPYTPGTDFGAWRQRNPLRVAMPGTVGVAGVRKPMSMFFPQTPSRISPHVDPNRVIEPADMQFRPQTPTPIEPPFEQQTPTPIEPSFEPKVPTPIDSPFEPKTPTPIETPPPTDSWRDYVYEHPGTEHQKQSPLALNRVKFPSYGWARFGTPMFDRVLKMDIRPGISGFDWLRQTYGDDYAWQIIEKGARNPTQWIKNFEQPLPQTPEPIEPRVEPPMPRRF